jgi:hypothetical protein
MHVATVAASVSPSVHVCLASLSTPVARLSVDTYASTHPHSHSHPLHSAAGGEQKALKNAGIVIQDSMFAHTRASVATHAPDKAEYDRQMYEK